MRQNRSKYEYRGDVERRRKRMRRMMLLVVAVAGSSLAWKVQAPKAANAEPSSDDSFSFGIGQGRLREQLDAARGERDLANAQLERAKKVIAFSSQYRIAADLASAVMDASAAEGIEPELAFRLVHVESEFNVRATSPVGAVGLTQLMPSTAKYFDHSITREKLYDRDTNLRIGFRYLRALINENHGNVKLALLVYNRGPVAVMASQAAGRNPSNGYDGAVTKGYKGKGTLD